MLLLHQLQMNISHPEMKRNKELIIVAIDIWPKVACACQQNLPKTRLLLMAFATEFNLAALAGI